MIKAGQVLQYSGYDIKSWKLIPPLRKKNFEVEKVTVSGDAPKDFISVYKYESGGKVFRNKKKTWPWLKPAKCKEWDLLNN